MAKRAGAGHATWLYWEHGNRAKRDVDASGPRSVPFRQKPSDRSGREKARATVHTQWRVYETSGKWAIAENIYR